MSVNRFTRRQFGLAVTGTIAAREMAQGAPGSDSENRGRQFPREVWVASMCQTGLKAREPQEMCDKMLVRMEETIPYQPDIVCTPELFPFVGLAGGVKPPISEWAEERTVLATAMWPLMPPSTGLMEFPWIAWVICLLRITAIIGFAKWRLITTVHPL